jgi:peptide-methionine (S)-S-oxide reductase
MTVTVLWITLCAFRGSTHLAPVLSSGQRGVVRMKILFLAILVLSALVLVGALGSGVTMSEPRDPAGNTRQGKDVVTLGGGCFWCIEPIFDDLKGVEDVESGYSGGAVVNPTYRQVCTGTTGHAEVIQVAFDPKIISLKELLEIFFHVHDPTTLNRQGNDVGTQYRSVIFFRDPQQRASAEQVIKEIQASKLWNGPVVTELAPFEAFYKAEDYHQEYFKLNGTQPYCRLIIAPKVAKFREKYRDKLKKPIPAGSPK